MIFNENLNNTLADKMDDAVKRLASVSELREVIEMAIAYLDTRRTGYYFVHSHSLQAYLDVSCNLIDDLDAVQDLTNLQVDLAA